MFPETDYDSKIQSSSVQVCDYQRLPTTAKMSQNTVVFTPRDRQISLFHGGNRGSNPLRDAILW